MRFVLIILVLILAAQHGAAAPGDVFDAKSKGFEEPATKRQFRPGDMPIAPTGFKIKKSVVNLGDIVALAIVDNDVFIADADQDRVLRLKSRNANYTFETRAEYLIGFDGIHDLATANGELFISDNNGVWQISAGNTLVAIEAPKRIYTNPQPDRKSAISMGISPDEKSLIVANRNNIISLNIKTGVQQKLWAGSQPIVDIAVSPTGSIWASIIENGVSYIFPVRAKNEVPARLELPPATRVTDLRFWDKEKFPEDWPEAWASDLIISLEGTRPMLARAQFIYGDIASELTSFIDGFSVSSRFVGRREYWGAPSAIETLANGQLIFAERERGTLWVLAKDDKPHQKTAAPKTQPQTINPEIVPDKKPAFPDLIRGSSIGSASGLETDELLKAPKQDKKEEEEE